MDKNSKKGIHFGLLISTGGRYWNAENADWPDLTPKNPGVRGVVELQGLLKKDFDLEEVNMMGYAASQPTTHQDPLRTWARDSERWNWTSGRKRTSGN